MGDRYIQTERISIELSRCHEGKAILDIGGGGEGFIGQLYGKNVIAIDHRLDELEETNNEAIKLVMDGANLAFTDDNFEVVTLFYSLMYMKNETKRKVLEEATRVLKPNGLIEIWDAEVPCKGNDGKDIFVAQLLVTCNGQETSTGFGIGMGDNDQSLDSILAIMDELGNDLVEQERNHQSFRLLFTKKV